MFLIPPVAQFSHSVVSDSLGPHGLQHARLSCPSLLELAQTHVHCISDATQLSSSVVPFSSFNLSQHQVFSVSQLFASGGESIEASASIQLVMPSNQLMLRSVAPFSSCLQSFPASGSFLMSQFFASGGQSFGVSASASVLAVKIQDWFPLGLTGWISLWFYNAGTYNAEVVSGASLIAQLVKNLPAMQETAVLSVSWEDLLEKGKKLSTPVNLASRISPWCCKELDRTAWPIARLW